MGATPVLNPYGGGIGTNTGAMGAPISNIPGMSNSGINPPGGNSQNPTGTQGGSTTASGAPMIAPRATSPGGGGVTGTPIAGSPSTGVPTTGVPTAPPAVTGLQPTATGENGQVLSNNTQTQEQTNRTLGELQNYYGEGIGSYIYNLMNTGGINENIANQTNAADINAMQGNINQGSANLNATLGAQGISANSSVNALANSQYQQGATAQENQVINQNYMSEYMQGQQMLESLLPGVFNTNQQGTANQPSVLDEITQGLELAGMVAMV